jgi:hypothetical protein
LDPSLESRDPYAAYCLDEAASYLLLRIEAGDKPHYFEDTTSEDEKHKRSLKAAWERVKKKGK